MRILQAVVCFYPAVSYGGPTRYVHRISKELVRRGHEVTVYTTNLLDRKSKLDGGTKEAEVDGIRVVYFNSYPLPFFRSCGGSVSPRLPWLALREIRDFDVIHIHEHNHFLAMVLGYYAHFLGKPYVVQPQNSLPVIFGNIILKELYNRLVGYSLVKHAHAVIALTEDERQLCLKVGIPADKITVNRTGFNLTEHQNLPPRGRFRAKHGIGHSDKLILFLGRLHEKKGLDILLRAYARLCDIDATHLVIAGPDNGFLPVIEKLVEELNLRDSVLLPGPLSGEEVFEAHVDADVFVMPSRQDAEPSAVVEALIAGTPVVISDRCQMTDCIQDRAGLVVPCDERSLEEALRRMLQDNGLREKFASSTQAVCKEFYDINHTIDRLEAVYTAVTQSNA